MTVGEYIKNARVAKGLQPIDLALELGVSQPTVYRWESGAMKIGEQHHAVLIEALDLDADEFYRVLHNRNGTVSGASTTGGKVSGTTAPAPELDVLDAIRRDSRLLPEARKHLMNQYKLLLRVAPGEVPPAAVLEDEAADLRSLPHAARKRRPPRKTT